MHAKVEILKLYTCINASQVRVISVFYVNINFVFVWVGRFQHTVMEKRSYRKPIFSPIDCRASLMSWKRAQYFMIKTRCGTLRSTAKKTRNSSCIGWFHKLQNFSNKMWTLKMHITSISFNTNDRWYKRGQDQTIRAKR